MLRVQLTHTRRSLFTDCSTSPCSVPPLLLFVGTTQYTSKSKHAMSNSLLNASPTRWLNFHHFCCGVRVWVCVCVAVIQEANRSAFISVRSPYSPIHFHTHTGTYTNSLIYCSCTHATYPFGIMCLVHQVLSLELNHIYTASGDVLYGYTENRIRKTKREKYLAKNRAHAHITFSFVQPPIVGSSERPETGKK